MLEMVGEKKSAERGKRMIRNLRLNAADTAEISRG